MFSLKSDPLKPVKPILMLLALSIGGCSQAEWNQYWDDYKVPTGYHYNTERKVEEPVAVEYKIVEETVSTTTYVPPAAPAEPVSSYRSDITVQNAGPADTWLSASEDIAGRLLARFGTPAEAVYLIAEDPGNPLNASFATSLKQALTARGLKVEAPGMGPFGLRYGAETGDDARTQLSLALMSGNKIAAAETGLYTLDGFTAATPPPAPATTEPAGSQPLSLIRPYN